MNYEAPGLQDILSNFSRLRQAPTGDGKRMPHKPLLILLMLGRFQKGDFSASAFHEIRPQLEELLTRFGPPSQPNAVNPFWRLQRDCGGTLWEVTDPQGNRVAETVTPPPIRELQLKAAKGGFSETLTNAFRAQPKYISALAAQLLTDHFPSSYHDDICAAVGLQLGGESTLNLMDNSARSRDANFRGRILIAYEYRCAVTGWDLRLGHMSTGLEAAHIRWHLAGGPCNEQNGIALNALHHKLFDLGVFTLSISDKIPRILVSREAHGNGASQEMLMRYHKCPIRPPQDPAFLPNKEFLEWHHKEVFRQPARV